VPDANDAERSVVLHYRVRNGLRFFEDHDELYWNVTGTEWTVPIEAASAHIVLPPGITGLRAANFHRRLRLARAKNASITKLGSNVGRPDCASSGLPAKD